MYSGGNDLMKEEKSLKEIHKIREELYFMGKEEKKKNQQRLKRNIKIFSNEAKRFTNLQNY